MHWEPTDAAVHSKRFVPEKEMNVFSSNKNKILTKGGDSHEE